MFALQAHSTRSNDGMGDRSQRRDGPEGVLPGGPDDGRRLRPRVRPRSIPRKLDGCSWPRIQTAIIGENALCIPSLSMTYAPLQGYALRSRTIAGGPRHGDPPWRHANHSRSGACRQPHGGAGRQRLAPTPNTNPGIGVRAQFDDKRAKQPIAAENPRLTRTTDPTTSRIARLNCLSVRRPPAFQMRI